MRCTSAISGIPPEKARIPHIRRLGKTAHAAPVARPRPSFHPEKVRTDSSITPPKARRPRRCAPGGASRACETRTESDTASSEAHRPRSSAPGRASRACEPGTLPTSHRPRHYASGCSRRDRTGDTPPKARCPRKRAPGRTARDSDPSHLRQRRDTSAGNE